jgi:DNA invertase Pin-like site-specific DNA recombinase
LSLAKTRNQIIDEIVAIQSLRAYGYRGLAAALDLCASPVYTEYLKDGEPQRLTFRGGKYGAGYARVSTIGQRDDGWSIRDQVARIVDFYLAKGEAFRVFVDDAMSGSLPTDDPALITRMYAASARRYEDAYTAVFLHDTSEFKSEHPALERWLSVYVDAMRRGEAAPDGAAVMDVDVTWREGAEEDRGNGDVSPAASGEDELSGSGEGLTADDKPHSRRGRARKRFGYRPALTELMKAVREGRIHTLVLTDLSRLARSQSLSAQLTEELDAGDIEVIGLIEKLDWIKNYRDFGGRVSASVLTLVAEYRLREVCVGSIRGIAQALIGGRPHGTLPHWLARQEDGSVVVVEERAEAIRRIVAYALEHETLGYEALATRFNADPERFPAPTTRSPKIRRRGRWHWKVVKDTLLSLALIGVQERFGRRWNVLPALIDDETYNRLLRRAAERPKSKQKVREGAHLMAYLMRCPCGQPASWWPHSGGQSAYYCCPTLQRARYDKSRPHAKMDDKSLEAFFDRLASAHPEILLNANEASSERAALTSELERLRSERDEAESEIPRVLEEAADAIRSKLKSVGLPYTDATLSALVAADPAASAAKERVASLRREVEQCRNLLASLLPSDQIGGLRDRLSRWDALNVIDRNDLLRQLIRVVECEMYDGVQLRLHIYPNLPNAEPLAPVEAITVRAGKGYSRFIPAFKDWLLSV